MAVEPKIPRWATIPVNTPTAGLQEPSEAKKDAGYTFLEKPTRNELNWLFNANYNYLLFLKSAIRYTVQVSSDGSGVFTQSTGALSFAKDLKFEFWQDGVGYINKIVAGSVVIPDGSVLVYRKSTSAATVTLTLAASYAALAAGKYVIVPEGSLTIANAFDDIIAFRRRDVSAGNDVYGVGFAVLECPLNGEQYEAALTSTTRFYFGGEKLGARRIFDGKSLTLYSGNGTGLTGQWDASTGNFQTTGSISLNPTQKLYFSGVGTDTYIYESSGNIVELFTGGTQAFTAQPAYFELGSTRDFHVYPTKKIHLDGGGDTYLIEQSANDVYLYAGGIIVMRWNPFGMNIPTGQKFYLDAVAGAGVDTYFYESSNNVISFFANGVGYLTVDGNQGTVFTGSDFAIPALAKLHLDGLTAGDTYFQESAANIVTLIAGGQTYWQAQGASNRLDFGTNIDVAIQTNHYLFFDGGGDTGIKESSANVMSFYAGSLVSRKMFLSVSGLSMQSANSFAVQLNDRVMFDGLSGDNYIVRNTAGAYMDFFNNGALRLRLGSVNTASGGVIVAGTYLASDTASGATPVSTGVYSNNVIGAKAFASLAALTGTMTLDGEHNVASVVVTQVGGNGQTVTVTFKTNLPNATYTVVAKVIGTNPGTADDHFNMVSRTAGGFVARINDGNNAQVTQPFTLDFICTT